MHDTPRNHGAAASRRRLLQTVGALAASGAAGAVSAGCIQQLRVRARREGRWLVVPAAQLAGLRRQEDTLTVRPEDADTPVLAVRRLHTTQGDVFIALEANCTHRGCPVVAMPDGFSCSCHGSSFGPRGAVRSGPATEPLRQLPAQRDEGGLRIDLGA